MRHPYALAAIRAADALVQVSALGNGGPKADHYSARFAVISVIGAVLCAVLGWANRNGAKAARRGTRMLGSLILVGFGLLVAAVEYTNATVGPKADAEVMGNGTVLPDAYLWSVAIITLVGVAAVVVLLRPAEAAKAQGLYTLR